MPTVSCTLGQDPADAALNRPVLVLGAADVAGMLALTPVREAPELASLLMSDGPERRVVGAGMLPEVRRAVRATLAGITAVQLPERLAPALALQRFDTACATAQEFGLNLYLTIDDG